MASQITVTDATTNQPLAGAAIFVVTNVSTDTPNYTTDSNGNAQISVTGTISSVSVSLDSATADYTPQQFSMLPSSVALVPIAPVTGTLTFAVAPQSDQSNPNNPAPTSGATLTLSNSGGGTLETLTVGSDGTCTTANQYPLGSYQVSISLTGYTSITNQNVTITEDSDLAFNLVKASTPNPTANPAAVAPPSTSGSTAALPNPSTPPPANPDQTYEYVYPNSSCGTYFQAAQARMYIGNLFIDELNTCQWQLMQNRIPVYGYRSKKFDAVGTGHSLVQGQLAINFVTEGYLYVALKEHARLMAATAPSNSAMTLAIQAQVDSLVQKYQQAYLPANQGPIVQQLMTLAAQDPTGAVSAYISDSLNTSLAPSGENACYLDIPFNIKVQFAGGGRTVTRTLTDCLLGANDFAYAHDGKTILDTYSFIAREMV